MYLDPKYIFELGSSSVDTNSGAINEEQRRRDTYFHKAPAKNILALPRQLSTKLSEQYICSK